jgi:opacity protein-like surface antigen
MNCTHSRWLAVMAGTTLASAASAEARWYITGGIASTSIESDGLAGLNLGGAIIQNDISDDATGFQLGGGAMFTDNFGIELKYSDSGDAKEDINVDVLTFTPFPVWETVPVSTESSLDGFTLYGVLQTALGEHFDLFGKLGFTLQDIELDIEGGGSVSDDDEGFALAGGGRYNFTDHFGLTAEIEYWAIDFDSSFEEPLRLSLNLQYLF